MDFKEYNKVIRADKDYLLFLKNGKDYYKVVRGEGDEPFDYSKEYFFIEDVSGEENVLTIRKPTSGTTYVNVSVSTDKVNWFDLGSTESGNLTYTIPANGKLYVRGNNAKWSDINGNLRKNSNSMYCSKPHNVCGNVMSLLYGDDFVEVTRVNDGALSHLFDYNLNLQKANNLILPATTLGRYCYSFMFYTCTALTTAPKELPATTLQGNCYYYMFQNCTSLTTTPALPATKLSIYCYRGMFNGCKALTTAPALPSTTLTTGCYQSMFYNCSSLTTAPTLPATTLTTGCYTNMFDGCTELKKVVTYANDISAPDCLNSWLYKVSKIGDFYNLGTATYNIDSINGIPTGWTEHKTLE